MKWNRSMNKPPRKRILIVTVNWLGDLLFMTPAIRSIRRAYPDSYIACLAPGRGLDLLTGNPHINKLISFEESRGLRGILHWLALANQLRSERFDTAFLFHRSFTRAFVVRLAGIRSRIGYRTWKQGWLLTQSAVSPSKDSVHKATWYLKLLEADQIPADGLRYDVELTREDHAAAEKLLKGWGIGSSVRLIALHVGSNWKLKRWPAESFAQLADALATKFDARIVFIGSGEDRSLIEKVIQRMNVKPLVAAGRTTLRQSGALLARSALVVSNDSGPLHLALAVGTPVVGLFGPTLPELSGPPSGAKAISLFGSIGCPVPCYQLNCPANLCMSEIRVDQVVAAAETFLHKPVHPEPFGSAQGRLVEG